MNKKRIITSITALLIATNTFVFSTYASDKDLYEIEDGKNVAAKVLYEFKPDSLFEVFTRIGYITDITLKENEEVGYIAAGDTERWMIDQFKLNGKTHIYIKPLQDNIKTNLIINTQSHSYRFLISSSKSNYTPIVEFNFTDEIAKKIKKEKLEKELTPRPLTKEEKEFKDIYTIDNGKERILKKMNKNYTVIKHGKVADDFYPLEIFDDGIRTYLKMPKSNKFNLPVLYDVNDENELSLVNYRVLGNYFIVDKVFIKARLQYSKKSYLEIIPNDTKNRFKNPKKLNYALKSKGGVKDVKKS